MHVLISVTILLVDLLTGPFLLFPILFIIPVSLCGWFCNARLAYVLAVLLPVGRFVIGEFEGQPYPLAYTIANAAVRVLVLLLLSFLVVRTSRQTKELRQRVMELVKICAWSRTIEYQGEWISFEIYLKRRFGIITSHGISPAEAQRITEDYEKTQRETTPNSAPNNVPSQPMVS